MNNYLSLASRFILYDRLMNDWKRTGCGTCKKLADKLYIEMLKTSNEMMKHNETTKKRIEPVRNKPQGGTLI